MKKKLSNFSQKLLLTLIVLVGFIVLSFYFFNQIKSNKEKELTNKPLEEKVEIGNGKEEETTKLELTQEQLKQYYQVYKDPYVLHLRKALNGYLDGTNEGMELPDTVIKSEESEDKTIRGLDSFDKAYYKSKFIVFSINDSLAGGKEIAIIFQDKPDKLFKTWVYSLADGRYDLRAFWQDTRFTEEEMKKIQEQYKTFLNDKEHAL